VAAFHAALAASVPSGEHIVLADTSHAINHERAETSPRQSIASSNALLAKLNAPY